MSLVTEAELGALYLNAKQAVIMQTTLHKIGHPQSLISIQTDNFTSYSVVMNK